MTTDISSTQAGTIRYRSFPKSAIDHAGARSENPLLRLCSVPPDDTPPIMGCLLERRGAVKVAHGGAHLDGEVDSGNMLLRVMMKYYEKSVQLGLNDPVPFNANEWIELPERTGLMRHLPSGRMYLVHSHGDMGSVLPFDPEDCEALLIDRGKKLPSRTELVEQALVAITAFLTSAGYWKKQEPIKPKPCRTFTAKRYMR
jgi:hypothetical protein